ncbi:protein yellow-like [Coccinella septempunctata]|uniref:protein yellow-like n=1 Tax=Coccinella septempunctata TaxID=41139 RepID=UPI001D099414|nr:protein yellow-like [Coccinella septempunctata]
MRKVCNYFSFLLLNYCAFPDGDQVLVAKTPVKRDFEVIHEWQYLNYTWPTFWTYNYALSNFQYIPENNAPTGIKIYGGKIFLSVPRFRPGIPVTLAYVSMIDEGTRSNERLRPFPNWELNINKDCEALQSVQSMEIDRQGYMWVIDGVRMNEETDCPAKLLILDLKDRGRRVHSYVFPDEIALSRGGFLNDLVIDDVGGGFAYITDNSPVDPGLIVYSLKKDRSWKLRDPRMFAELQAADFVVNGIVTKALAPIDGIALSPAHSNKNKRLFFSALTGYNLYAIDTSILKNESLSKTDQWRRSVVLIGKKEAQSDGLMIDTKGNLYYTLLPLNGIGRWNINTPIATSEIIYKNKRTMIWPDTFAMDEEGYLYVISNNINQFIDPKTEVVITGEVKFRIFRYFTGTKSYMY